MIQVLKRWPSNHKNSSSIHIAQRLHHVAYIYAACGHPGLPSEVVCCLPAQPPAVWACELRTVRHGDIKWWRASGHSTGTIGFHPPLGWFRYPCFSGGLHSCGWHQLLPCVQRPTRHTFSTRLITRRTGPAPMTRGSTQRRLRRWSSLSGKLWIWHRSPLATI